MTWTDNPVADAERYIKHCTASRRAWELDNYKGDCPYCGKPMFTETSDWEENYRYDEELGDFAHEYCSWQAREDAEEAEEAFDEMMGNPMEELDSILKVTA